MPYCIDQLLLGTYVVAIESMKLGKLVLCHLREDMYKFNPIENGCSILDVNPNRMKTRQQRALNKAKVQAYGENIPSLKHLGRRFDVIKSITQNIFI